MRNAILALFIGILLILAGCSATTAKPPGANNTTVPGGAGGNNTTGANNTPGGGNASGNGSISNPASVFCAAHNGTLEIKDGAEGQYGVCSFASGAKCEEWAYFREECSPEKPNYCQRDSDCACGVHKTTRECFYGQKEFVDTSSQCPDYCNGIAAHLEIKCVQNQCKQVQKKQCEDYGVNECPSDCDVCPPCPECSSLTCQDKGSCPQFGLGK